MIPILRPKGPGLELGQRVRITHTLTRRWSRPDPNRYGGERKAWVAGALTEPREGIVVGIRSLADGTVHYLGMEEGVEFRPERRYPAVMVAWHLRRKPALVLPEHLEPVQ